MKKNIKIIFISLFILAGLGFYLLIQRPYFFSTGKLILKYKVGDCLKHGDKVYLYDSDGPTMKGSYGLLRILPTRRDIGEAHPIERVEGGSYIKVDCSENLDS